MKNNTRAMLHSQFQNKENKRKIKKIRKIKEKMEI